MTTIIERVGAAILNECQHFGALAHKTPLEMRLARAAVDEFMARVKESIRNPPHAYFWPDNPTASDIVARIEMLSKEEAKQ